MARELGKLTDVSKGAAGGMGNMAKAMGSLDMGGTLAAKLAQANAVMGKPLHEMNAMQLAAFENITGISGEQREILLKVSQGLTGNFGVLEDLQADIQSGDPKRQAEAMDYLTKNGDQMLKQYGATVNSMGEIVSVQEDGTEKVISNLGEYIQGQGDQIAKATEVGMDENTALAQEIAANTTDLGTILEMGVQWVLEQIYGVMTRLLAYFTKVDPKEQQKSMDSVRNEIEQLRRQERETRKDLSKARVDAKKLTGDEKVAAEAKVKELEGKLVGGQISMRQKSKSLRRLSTAGSEDEFKAAQMTAGVRGMEGAASGDAAKAAAADFKQAVSEVLGEGVAKAIESGVQKKVSRTTQEYMGGDQMGGAGSTARFQSISQRLMVETASKVAQGADVEKTVQGITAQDIGKQAGLVENESTQQQRRIESWMGSSGTAGKTEADMEKEAAASSLRVAIESGVKKETLGPTAGDVGTKEYAQKRIDELLEQTQFLEGDQWDAAMDDLTHWVHKLKTIEAEEAFQKAVLPETKAAEKEKLKQLRSADKRGLTKEERAEKKDEAVGEEVQQMYDQTYEKQDKDNKEALVKKIREDGKIAKKSNKEIEKDIEGQTKDLIDFQKRESISKFIQDLQVLSGHRSTREETVARIKEIEETGKIPERVAAEMAGMTEEKRSQLTIPSAALGKFDDFVFRPGQRPMSFSSEDTLVGAKSGGPIDNMLGGGGGGGRPITINVYGSQGEIVRTVKRVLETYA
jgi:hypothetical protein